MKLFRKKNKRKPDSSPVVSPESENQFYSRNVNEPTLDETYQGPVGRQTMRTSRHSPARRRENSNRASNWAITLLLLRALLVVGALAGGYLVLKTVLGRMAGPTEKDEQRWEANAVLMDGGAVNEETISAAFDSMPQALEVSDDLIAGRLEQWALADRYLRSADALARRGINDDAIERLSQVLRTSPDNRAAQKQLMELYMRTGAFAQAIPLCIRLLDQDGGQWDIQMSLMTALQKSGRSRASLMLANRLLEIQPGNLEILNIAAKGSLAEGDTERALDLYDQILKYNARDKAALLGSAEIYRAENAWEKAVPYYLELVRVEPSEETYYALALCYAQQADAGKAVVFMGQAASLYGEAAVSPWLRDAGFDAIREAVEFRSFADRTIGIENRKAIEAISRREAEKKSPAASGGLELPQQPQLNSLTPGK